MRHRNPSWCRGQRFQIARLRLQIRAVIFEIGRPDPAGVFIAIDDHRPIWISGFDKSNVAGSAAFGGATVGRGIGPRILTANRGQPVVGIGDPHNIVLRQGVMQKQPHDQQHRQAQAPFKLIHCIVSLLKVHKIDRCRHNRRGKDINQPQQAPPQPMLVGLHARLDIGLAGAFDATRVKGFFQPFAPHRTRIGRNQKIQQRQGHKAENRQTYNPDHSLPRFTAPQGPTI